MKSIALGFLATAIAATSAIAGSPDMSKDKNPLPPEVPCFRDRELQLDIFGAYENFAHDGIRDERGRPAGRDGGGGGLGINYFFCRYVGVGVDGSLVSNREGTWNYGGKVIIRYPIEMGRLCIAPYIFGGGGGQSPLHSDHRFDGYDGQDAVGMGFAGLGLEWRATPHIGVFTEGRYTWTEKHSDADNTQVRLGLRVAF